jgi:preprotein translocase subunit SecA
MSSLDFAGFMSGINTSLVNPVEVEELTEDSAIDVTIDFEKLHYNMHEAQADWLYNLPEWDGILSKEKRKEIKAAYNSTKTVVKGEKIGRNDPCPCGSGKKYKKCCGK